MVGSTPPLTARASVTISKGNRVFGAFDPNRRERRRALAKPHLTVALRRVSHLGHEWLRPGLRRRRVLGAENPSFFWILSDDNKIMQMVPFSPQ